MVVKKGEVIPGAISFADLPKDKMKEIATKGGAVKSTAKKIAARLRWFREKGDINDDDVKVLLDMMESPDLSAMHLEKYTLETLKMCENATQRTQAINTLANIHKLKYGEKRHNTNVNVNLDFSNKMAEFRANLKQFQSEDEGSCLDITDQVETSTEMGKD